MNFWRTLFFSALAVAAFTGCKDDDDDVNGGNDGIATITVDGKKDVSAAVKDEGETVSVKVVSTGDWTLAFDDAAQTWLAASAMEGKGGESNVTFTVKEALPEGEAQRTVKAEFSTRGVVMGKEYMAKATVTVTQSENGNVGGETVIIYKETFGTDANVANTDVDKYTDWAKTGEGAANVTYVGTNVSVRKSSPNNSTSYADASGAPILFFGKVPATFIVQNIALTAEQTNLQLTFGGQQTIDYDSKNYTWSNDNLLVALSADGEVWSTIEYTTNNGDQNADGKNWVLATANFTLAAPSDKLYIRFTSPVLASNLRIDDITLQTGLGGQQVDLSQGDPEPEAIVATIAEITAAGKYQVENATVIAAYAAGFLMQDATGIMLVYPGEEATIPAVGKVVTVKGDVALYGGVLQFGNGTVISETGEGTVPATPEPTEITAENIAGFMTSPSITYIKTTGNFAISGNYRNLTFTTFETNYKGSIVAPAVEGSLDQYNGKLVDITGWFLNNANGTTYLSILVTDIEENQTEQVFNFITKSATFAAENPAEQTINFVAQNIAEEQLTFAFTGDNADKFEVVSKTANTVTIKAVGDNTSEGTYNATLTAKVNGEVLGEIDVMQSAPTPSDAGDPYSWTLAQGQITTAGGTIENMGTPAMNWTSTAVDYIGFDSNATAKGVQIGSGSKPAANFELSTEAYSGKITSIVIESSVGSGGNGKLTVKIGDTQVGEAISLTTTSTSYTFTPTTPVTGKITIVMGATAKAMYIKSVNINPAAEAVE